MYPKRSDSIICILSVFLIAILMVCLFIVLFLSYCSEEPESSNIHKSTNLMNVDDIKLPIEELSDDVLYEKLDAYEKHFDADSYFVFINTKYDVVGIYYGYKPLNHFRQDFEDTEHLSITLEDLLDYGIELNDEIKDYLNFFVEFPKTTPVIVTHITL